MEQLVDVTGVEVIAEHQLRLTFADGVGGEVDFRATEWRGLLAPLADASFFAQVRVDPQAGTIAWPGGIDFAPEPLYEEARRQPSRGRP